MGDGVDGVVVNRLKSLFCGLGCIHIAPDPLLAHAHATSRRSRAAAYIGIHRSAGCTAQAGAI